MMCIHIMMMQWCSDTLSTSSTPVRFRQGTSLQLISDMQRRADNADVDGDEVRKLP